MSAQLVVGGMVCFLDNYHWFCGKVTWVGSKKVKIACGNGQTYTKPREKCAAYDEIVAVVWEQWKGRNGRGSYRVERELYSDLRKPAQQIAYNARLYEKEHGVLLVPGWR